MKPSFDPTNLLSTIARVALPAAAAFVGSEAAASIVYTNITGSITTPTQTLFVNMDGGVGGTGSISFSDPSQTSDFSLGYSNTPPETTANLDKPRILPNTNTGAQGYVRITTGGPLIADKLSQGEVIQSSDAYNDAGTIYDKNSTWGANDWAMGDTGYLGIKFTNSVSAIRYGWVGLTYGSDKSLTVNGFAYEDSGASIVAGAIPEPATVGLISALLAGSAVAYAKRRKAKSVA